MADLRGAGLDDRRRDGQDFLDRIHVELEVECQRLCGAEGHVGRLGRPKPGSRHADLVHTVRQVWNDVHAGIRRGHLRFDVGFHIGRHHGRSDEHTAARVGNRAVELGPRPLRVREAAAQQTCGDDERLTDSHCHCSSHPSNSNGLGINILQPCQYETVQLLGTSSASALRRPQGAD